MLVLIVGKLDDTNACSPGYIDAPAYCLPLASVCLVAKIGQSSFERSAGDSGAAVGMGGLPEQVEESVAFVVHLPACLLRLGYSFCLGNSRRFLGCLVFGGHDSIPRRARTIRFNPSPAASVFCLRHDESRCHDDEPAIVHYWAGKASAMEAVRSEKALQQVRSWVLGPMPSPLRLYEGSGAMATANHSPVFPQGYEGRHRHPSASSVWLRIG